MGLKLGLLPSFKQSAFNSMVCVLPSTVKQRAENSSKIKFMCSFSSMKMITRIGPEQVWAAHLGSCRCCGVSSLWVWEASFRQGQMLQQNAGLSLYWFLRPPSTDLPVWVSLRKSEGKNRFIWIKGTKQVRELNSGMRRVPWSELVLAQKEACIQVGSCWNGLTHSPNTWESSL